jgi:thioesterase domain-containing protein
MATNFKSLDYVKEAWAAALAPLICDYTLTWEASGGDSQSLVYLFLHLEDALARRLPYEIMQPGMTVQDLQDAIEWIEEEPPEPARPLVFLLPGIYGDEPVLADFRRRFAGTVDFQLVDLPDIGAPARILTSVTETARLIAAEILRRQPNGGITVAGFSFGASVAFETSRLIAGSGRTVSSLTLLDGVFDRAKYTPAVLIDETDRAILAVRQRHWLVTTIRRWVKAPLRVLCCFDPGRTFLYNILRKAAPRKYFAFRKWFLRQVRNLALQKWHPSPVHLPEVAADITLIALSKHYGPATGGKWAELCPAAEIVRLGCSHTGILNNDEIVGKIQRIITRVLSHSDAGNLRTIYDYD